jgi:hypothetical protein
MEHVLAILNCDTAGRREKVSIDASGFIRETDSTARFSDGSTTHRESTFSDFGCAGKVLMPRQLLPLRQLACRRAEAERHARISGRFPAQ